MVHTFVKGESYLIIWKMSTAINRNASDVSLAYWVLNQKQVEYFASKGFEIRYLNLAEPGKLEIMCVNLAEKT